MNSDKPNSSTQTESPNIFPFQSNILCADRHLLNGHRSALVWFTGLSPEDRKENIRRIAEAAKLMVDAGILVFAAFIAPYRESREFIKDMNVSTA